MHGGVAQYVPTMLAKQQPVGPQLCSDRFPLRETSIRDVHDAALNDSFDQLAEYRFSANRTVELNRTDRDRLRYRGDGPSQSFRKSLLDFSSRVFGCTVEGQLFQPSKLI